MCFIYETVICYFLYRDFIEQSYVPLKQANPKFPILVRECSGVQPRLWARYGKILSVLKIEVDTVTVCTVPSDL